MIQFVLASGNHDKITDLHVNILKKLVDNDEDVSKYITEIFTDQEEDAIQILSNGKTHSFSIYPIKEFDLDEDDGTKSKGYVIIISYNLFITKINDVIQVIIDIDNDETCTIASGNADMSEDSQTNLDLMNKYLDFKKAYEKKVGSMNATELTISKLFGGTF